MGTLFRKRVLGFMLIGAFCLLPSLVHADNITATDNAGISLTIHSWVAVQFDEGDFQLVVENGQQEASANLGFSAETNMDATLSIDVIPPQGAPGLWSASVDQASLVEGQAFYGMATVTVTDVPVSQASQTYTQGLATITITGAL